MMSLFWIVFGLQVAIWVFFSLTRVGRFVAVIWGALAIILWYLYVYTNYIPLAMTGNIELGIFAIKATILSWTNLILQLVIPPWVGLFLGTAISQNVGKT